MTTVRGHIPLPVEKSVADPNPLDPENHYFRLCLKGHVRYAVSFAECPSCKIERERNTGHRG